MKTQTMVVPQGCSIQKVASGRKNADRWSVYHGTKQTYGTWIGDVVNFKGYGEGWEFQPREGDTQPCPGGPVEAMLRVSAYIAGVKVS